jgi:flap endonuclease-1
MGIKNFTKFIKKYAPNSIKLKNLKNLKNKIIAIDASFIIYRSITAIRATGQDLKNKKGYITSHLYSIFFKSIKFIKNGTTLIYVFDGCPPDLKIKNIKKRKQLKEISEKKIVDNPDLLKKEFKKTFEIDDYIIKSTKRLLDHLGIQYIDAPGEADVMLAYLSHNNIVDGIYSDDADILAFSGSTLCTKFDKMGNYCEIQLETILKESKINFDQFVIMCLLLGCDYCENIKKMGMKNAYNIIMKYKTFNDVFEKIDKKYYKCYLEAYGYFRQGINLLKFDEKIIYNKKINSDELFKFMVKENNFDKQRILNGINKILKK